jgi:formylglycine-generating enzyme required for sulfatase activity
VPKPAVTQQAAVIKPPQRPPMAAPYEMLRDCGQCPELVKLPGGKFHMGSNDDPTERPIHQVTIAPFAIGRFAVTIGEWKQCVAAKACDYELTGDNDVPAHNLSWNDARQYVAWLSKMTGKNYRLPTEAEWEYAARGGTTTRYWWGNAFERGRADCEKCGEPYDEHQPLKVGSFPANPFGLHDMAGGVLQWVLDCWHNNYSGAPTNSASWEAKICHQRVLRGGSWKNDSSYARASSRDRYDPAVRYWTHGLRVARSL